MTAPILCPFCQVSVVALRGPQAQGRSYCPVCSLCRPTGVFREASERMVDGEIITRYRTREDRVLIPCQPGDEVLVVRRVRR